jgi:hypothetical protein
MKPILCTAMDKSFCGLRRFFGGERTVDRRESSASPRLTPGGALERWHPRPRPNNLQLSGRCLAALRMTIIAAGMIALGVHASEVDQLKSDLIGQYMGGREKCWKFQSRDQIKELVIKNKSEDSQKRVYSIALQLQAGATGGRYAAEARVEYAKAGAGWKIKQVGLLSIAKVESPDVAPSTTPGKRR